MLELIRETRAGGLNSAKYGERFSGTGVYADMLSRRFALAARQWGLDNRETLDTAQFNVPNAPKGMAETQLSLF